MGKVFILYINVNERNSSANSAQMSLANYHEIYVQFLWLPFVYRSIYFKY